MKKENIRRIDDYSRSFLELMYILMTSKKSLSILEMSEAVKVSKRTINYYLKKMRDEFSSVFQLVNDNGTKLEIVDPIKYNEIKNKLQISFSNSLYSKDETRNNRVLDIMSCLLENDGYLSMSDIADRIYYSLSSLKKCFPTVKKIMEDYNLRIITKTRCGCKIDGEEFYKRYLLAQIVEYRHIHDGITNEDTNYGLYYNVDSKQRDCMKKVLIEVLLNEKSFYISNPDLKILYKYLIIAVNRCQKGHSVKISSTNKELLENTKQLSIAQTVIKELSEQYPFLDQQEAYAFGLMLLINVHFNPSNSAESYQPFYLQAKDLGQQLFRHLRNELYFDINYAGEQFVQLLFDFLTKLLISKKLFTMNAQLLDEEEKVFSLDSWIALISKNFIEKQLGCKLSNSVIKRLRSIFSFGINQFDYKHGKVHLAISTEYGYFQNFEILENLKRIDHGMYIDSMEIIPFYGMVNLKQKNNSLVLLDYPKAYYSKMTIPVLVIDRLHIDYLQLEKRIEAYSIDYQQILENNGCEQFRVFAYRKNERTIIKNFFDQHQRQLDKTLQEIKEEIQVFEMGADQYIILPFLTSQKTMVELYCDPKKKGKTLLLSFSYNPSVDFIRLLNTLMKNYDQWKELVQNEKISSFALSKVMKDTAMINLEKKEKNE